MQPRFREPIGSCCHAGLGYDLGQFGRPLERGATVFSEYLDWKINMHSYENADESVSEDYSVAITRPRNDMARQKWLDGDMT
jgi:hypothetical protein